MPTMFSKEIIIRFRQADPAGILWFGHILPLVHDTFEDFIVASGFSWKEWFSVDKYLIPIRHVEIDFLAPFTPGDRYQIRAGVENISHSSFQMKYKLTSIGAISVDHAQVSMVHTFLDNQSKSKIAIPP